MPARFVNNDWQKMATVFFAREIFFSTSQFIARETFYCRGFHEK
jgi:hypothetical protein